MDRIVQWLTTVASRNMGLGEGSRAETKQS